MKNKSIPKLLISLCVLLIPAFVYANPQGWKCLDVDRRLNNASLTVKTAADEIDKAQESIKSLEQALAKLTKDCAKLSGPQCSSGYRQNLQMNLQSAMQKRAQVTQIRVNTQAKLSELKTLRQDCQGQKIEMVKDIPDSLRRVIR